MSFKKQKTSSKGTTSEIHDFELLKLSDYYVMVRQRWLTGLFCAILASSAVGYLLFSRPPVYEANAALIVEREGQRVLPMQEVTEGGLQGTGGLWRVVLENHVTQLVSRSFTDYVEESFSEEERRQLIEPYLRDDPEEYPPSVYGLLRGVMVENLPNTFVLEVRARHRDPEMAALLADRYVERYIDLTNERGDSGNQSAIDFLQRQAKQVAEKVEQAEQALQDYRRKHNLVSVEGDQNLIAQRLNEVSAHLTTVQMERIDLEERIGQVQNFRENEGNLLELEIASLRSVPEILAEVNKLRQERKVMSEKYLERHPAMIANERSIAAGEELIQANINLAIAELESRLENARQRESRLLAELQEAEKESLRIDRLTIQDAALRREIDVARTTHSQILDRLNETSVTSQLERSTIRIIDHASVPGSPAEPSPIKIVLLMAVLGGFCFIGAPIGLAAFDRKFKAATDVESYVGQNLLGEISNVRRVKRIERPHIVSMELDDSTSEAFRGLIGQLHLRQTRSILLTSTLPGEGKSFVASNLAAGFAAHGKRTVIVDFDLRSPALHRFYGRSNVFGVLRWLEEGGSSSDLKNQEALGITEVWPNLYLLCAGGQTKRATETITHPKVADLIEALKREFDEVIVDTPPLGVFPDALALAPMLSDSLYVVKFGKVNRQQVRNYVHRLLEASPNLIGMVMNGMPRGAAAAYYRSGYAHGNSKYAKYYGKRK